MLKRMTAAALLASLLFSQPVSASLITQVGEAEAAAGIDNSDKSLIERLKILENETGLEGNEGTLSERVAAVERELGLDGSGAFLLLIIRMPGALPISGAGSMRECWNYCQRCRRMLLPTKR